MLELPPLGLYIHIPWCIRKCPYCDFNSHEMDTELPQADYVEALCEDLDAELVRFSPGKLQSIFIGGGTPSLIDAVHYEKLFRYIGDRLEFDASIEITLEANPGTVDANRFTDYRKLGINRLSLGIQSFNDRHLERLGRIHNADEARRAIDIAREAGFNNFNLDLMHGLPEQSPAEALADLSAAFEFKPNHLSWYQLTIEPNTHFFSRPPTLPTESALSSIQKHGQSLLAERGYQQYEVSAYSLQGKQSKHNLNYWQFGDYLGIGAGAHGKLSDPEGNKLWRTRKLKQPSHYIKNSVNREAELVEIKESDRALEFLMNALRLREGFSKSLFEQRTGLPFSVIAKRVEYLESNDLLCCDNDRITTSETGYQLLNSVLEEFL